MKSRPSIVWFRQDLRLADNPALSHALLTPGSVLPLYILDDEAFGNRRPGAAQRWWLHHSLESLDHALRSKGLRLLLRRGPAQRVLREILEESDAGSLYWNRCYDPQSVSHDRDIKAWARASGLDTRSFGGLLLMEPWEIATKQGSSYRVFTPFWCCLRQRYEHRLPLAAPASLPGDQTLGSDPLEGWSLCPQNPDWAALFHRHWQPGEAAAQRRLADFLENSLTDYKNLRDRPDRRATSRLSPHLRFGEISPRQIWQAVHDHLSLVGGDQADADKFLSEIAWREFSYHLLFHETALASAPLRSAFAEFPWRNCPDDLRSWQRGETGYPIVDAGMRELWASGWMHNRVRMIVASFLVKDLLIAWQQGEAWFWDTLLDGDPASNPASWQWVAGCGADAAPFFRIFNPVTQGERFDPEGDYIRTWLPELANLPNRYIQRPWEVDPITCAAAGLRLGDSYPHRIVDHSLARTAALEAYRSIKKDTGT